MKTVKWYFRNNAKRKLGNKNKGRHPALIIGESDDGKSYVNIGLTNSSKRGNHKYTPIYNPQNWNKTSF